MYPIKTYTSGKTTIKICTEDIHKLINGIAGACYKAAGEIFEKLESYKAENGDYIVESIGIATPTQDDQFDQNIGNEIAFRKVKLSANLKKARLLIKCIKSLEQAVQVCKDKLDKVTEYIKKDTEALRTYNDEFIHHL